MSNTTSNWGSSPDPKQIQEAEQKQPSKERKLEQAYGQNQGGPQFQVTGVQPGFWPEPASQQKPRKAEKDNR